MSLSSFAKDVIEKVISSSIVNRSSNNSIQYDITLSDTRDDPVAMISSFKFKRPIKESTLEERLPEFYDLLGEYLSAEKLGVINAVLQKYGLASKEFGKSKLTGTLPANTEDTAVLTGDSLTSVRTKSGRFISLSNLKSLLEITTKTYMMQHMTEGGPQLHNRTGRFINSTNIRSVIVIRTGISGKLTLRIVYGYMTYPYETFDPAGPNSRGLATVDRNPRKIIGDAITKATDDLINMQFYQLEVQQQ